MRTTVTLDADVAHQVKAEMRATGKAFKAVVNETMRKGFRDRARPPFVQKTYDLGEPLVTLDHKMLQYAYTSYDQDKLRRLAEQDPRP